MRMTLLLWGKYDSMHRELFSSNLLILRSESTLKTKCQTLSVHEGYCPNNYSIFYDKFIKNKLKSIGYDNENVISQLMCGK